jgi:predicted ATP-binding protein involved in virulence
MRIDRLVITNFDGFDRREFTFHPRFNLLIGDNASGKTSLLDALAIAVGSWFLGLRGYQQVPGIGIEEVRAVPHRHEDSITFEKQFPARIDCHGDVMGTSIAWTRELKSERGRTTSIDARWMADIASETEKRVRAGESVTLPLIAAYGTERLWFEQPHRKKHAPADARHRMPSRLDAYRDCIKFTIEEAALIEWTRDQSIVIPRTGKEPAALAVVKSAILNCIEGAASIYYDGRYKDLVVELPEPQGTQLFSNLSDGQRIMLTLVGDLARRAATLNPHLGIAATGETPGVVLIDELDLHLHPKWQRRVMQDLKLTFPGLQFIATTHSPQLIGEALPEEIRILDDNRTTIPKHSLGLDSSRVVEEIMGAESRNEAVTDTLSHLSAAIDAEDFGAAEGLISEMERTLGPDDPEVTRARALMSFLTSSK